MKQTYRINTFETNSSSTHTCILVSDEDYKKFLNEEYLISYDSLIAKDDVTKEYKKSGYDGSFEDYCDDNDYYTFDEYKERYEILRYDETSAVIDGVKVHALCWCGYDG